METWDEEYCYGKRHACINRALALPFLDAVFAIHHFNRRERGYCNYLPEITAAEVFSQDQLSQSQFASAIDKVTKLMRENFGECDCEGDFEQRCASLIARNPGFSVSTYVVAYNDWQHDSMW